jgi:hypothetical protein
MKAVLTSQNAGTVCVPVAIPRLNMTLVVVEPAVQWMVIAGLTGCSPRRMLVFNCGVSTAP